jgi:hypothetical protein
MSPKKNTKRPHAFTVRLVLSETELQHFQTEHNALIKSIAESGVPTLSLASYLRMRANDLLINEVKTAKQPTELLTKSSPA